MFENQSPTLNSPDPNNSDLKSEELTPILESINDHNQTNDKNNNVNMIDENNNTIEKK